MTNPLTTTVLLILLGLAVVLLGIFAFRSQATRAIARLTFWEGIRMRIVLVFVMMLVFIVTRLPFALRGDETLAGRLQTFLSYSLGTLGILASLTAIFLSCATLAGEFRTRTLHMVVTKPVTRFEILLGKWLGVNALCALILAFSGLTIYGFALFIKSQPEAFIRDRIKVNDVVWTARVAADATEPDFRKAAEEQIEARIADGEEFLDREGSINSIAAELSGEWKMVPPFSARVYEFEGLPPPEDERTVYQVRFKARAVPFMDQLKVGWGIVDPRNGALLDHFQTDERSGEIHQFLVNASNIVYDGRATLAVQNPPDQAPETSVLFEGDQSLQILYKVSSFERNYLRTLVMILFRLAFLSAVGLFFGTFVSFPVACFCVLSIFVFCIGAPWWLESIGANLQIVTTNVDPYGSLGWLFRLFLVPILRVLLPNFIAYDGVTDLIDGFLVDPWIFALAGAHTFVLGAVLLLLPGWLIFRSREVAEVIV